MASSNPTQHAMEFGTLIVGRFDGTYRRDVYVSRDGERFNEPAFAAGPSDKSPRHDGMSASYGGHYDSRCSCCFLGATHTVEYHRKNLGE